MYEFSIGALKFHKPTSSSSSSHINSPPSGPSTSVYSFSSHILPYQSARSYSTSSPNPNNTSAVIPVKIYSNADIQKQDIINENKNKSGIYQWINRINSKTYIGSSVNLSRRFYEYYNLSHLEKSKMVISKALLKYGYASFSLEILEYCDRSILLKREQFYIDLLSPEYNINPKAASRLGTSHTPETRKKMSDAKKGSNHPLYGKTPSDETKKRMSHALGTTIFMYSLDNQLLSTFTSSVAAAKYFSCTFNTILKYARSRYIFKSQYILSLEPLENNLNSPFKLNSTTIFVYSLDYQLLHTFSSSRAVAKHFDCSKTTIMRYVRSRNIFRGEYLLSLEELPLKGEVE